MRVIDQVETDKANNDNDKGENLGNLEVSKHCIHQMMCTYNIVVFGLVMELECLPENNKEGIRSVDGEGCIYKCMICTITRRVITQAMVDEHQGSQLPKKTNKSKDAEMEEPQEGNGAVDDSDQQIPEPDRLKHI